MCRPVLGVMNLGVLAGLIGVLSPGTALAQYASYPSNYGGYSGYAPAQGGWSVQVGVGSPIQPSPVYGGYPGGGGYPGNGAGYVSGYGGGSGPRPGYSGNYGSGYGYGYGGPAVVAPGRPSPAARQGYREGEVYWETGLAPNRPLSPAEARGFAAGERRAAATPWQLDPARQQGYREGQVYWETGLAPNRPLTPAEAQGFRAGENRASVGYGSPY